MTRLIYKENIILQLDTEPFVPLPEQLQVNGKLLKKKSEFHITILNSKWNKFFQDYAWFSKEIATRFGANTKKMFSILDEYYHIQTTTPSLRESVISLVEFPMMKEFYTYLADYHQEMPADAFPHITLYTWGDPKGIGIVSVEKFHSLQPQSIRLEHD